MESCPVELGWWDYINLGPGRRQMAHLRVNWREFNKQIFYKVVDWAEWTNKRWWSFWKLCTGRSHQLPWWWKVWEEWHPWTWQALPNWSPYSGLLGNHPLSLPVLQLSCRCLRWPPAGRAKSSWGCRLPRQTHETQNRTDRENGNRKTKEWDQFTLQLLPSTEGDLVWLRVMGISHVAVLMGRWIARWWQWCYPWFILVSSWFIFSLEEYPMHVVPVSVHAAGFPLSVMTALVFLSLGPVGETAHLLGLTYEECVCSLTCTLQWPLGDICCHLMRLVSKTFLKHSRNVFFFPFLALFALKKKN